ncbi:MAG: hypothetical protein IIA19_09000 [Thaumarchaeota archaeon]|nr:hypothetical protein [Nitrososphaerota archaeon]
MKKHLSLIAFAFFISTILLFDSAFAAVSEGCEIFEIKAGCDLSGWMKVIFAAAIGGGLGILLHTLSHRTNLKLERNHEQLKENTEQLKENSIAIQKILDAQEYSSNRRRDYLLASTKSSFNAILLRLGMMNRIVLNKENIDTDDQYSRLELEEIAIHAIIEKVRHTTSLAVDILDPMLATQIDNLFTFIEQLSPSKNKEKLEFSEYDDVKEKIMHMRDRLEEFVITKQVLK